MNEPTNTAQFSLKLEHGHWFYRSSAFITGCWKPIPSPIHLLALYLRTHYDKYRGKSDTYIFEDLHMYPAAVSRIKHGLMSVPYDWPLRVYDAVGMPIDECRRMLMIDYFADLSNKKRTVWPTPVEGEQQWTTKSC